MNVEDRYRYRVDEGRIELKPGHEPAQKYNSVGERWMAKKIGGEVVRNPLKDVDDGWLANEAKTAVADGGKFKPREAQHFANLWLSRHEQYRERCYGLVVVRPDDGDNLEVVDDAIVPVEEFHCAVEELGYSWTPRGDDELGLEIPWHRLPWLEGRNAGGVRK